MDDYEAIQRVRLRDWSGLETLIDRYQLRAVRAAFLVTGDQQASEDIVTEAFYRAWKNISQFDSSRPFAPWFFTIVMNAARRAVSQSNHNVGLSETPPNSLASDSGFEFDPEAMLIRAESRDEILTALFRLPVEQRIAIIQRYFLGLTVEQIADQAYRPTGTIKWRLSEARKRLRDWLSRLDGEKVTTDPVRRKEC